MNDASGPPVTPDKPEELASNSTESASRTAVVAHRTFRTIAIAVHRYVGLAMTLFLVVAGLTGSLGTVKQLVDPYSNQS